MSVPFLFRAENLRQGQFGVTLAQRGQSTDYTEDVGGRTGKVAGKFTAKMAAGRKMTANLPQRQRYFPSSFPTTFPSDSYSHSHICVIGVIWDAPEGIRAMGKLNIAPTKSNLLQVKRDLALAAEGFGLLEQKREILVIELMRRLEEVRVAQARLRSAQATAYTALRQAIARNGAHRLASLAAGVRYPHAVTAGSRVTAGVRVPEVGSVAAKPAAKFGFAGSDATVDQVMREFLALLGAVGAMAELETAVWKLALELKKTQRRVNALEQLFIPSYKETLKFIGETLEGKELDSFFVMKLIKKQLGAKEEAEGGGQ